MPNDLVIRPIGSPLPPEPAPAPPASIATPAPGVAQTQSGAEALPNPTLRLDPALGMVVIEFHNGAGAVTTSIPDARQLDAYRMARELNDGVKIGGDATPTVHSLETRDI